jgi:hypothetical protein
MGVWIFSSNTIENIRVAKDRLMWGFWDREAGKKQRENWRQFIRLYNRIKPFDIALIQIAGTGEVHAVAIVKDTYYDDQTPVWPNEMQQKKVLYPWRVSFSNIIFSDIAFASLFTKIESYVDGYGIGEPPEHEFRKILSDVEAKTNAEINYEV